VELNTRQENISVTELHERRQASAVPILDEFKKWLDHRVEKVPPKSLLGKAIRPFVVGRKNWLFSGSPRGAHASAMLYSLIETAKANGLEPYWYLRHLFTKLPEAMTTEDFTALTPQHVDKGVLENFSF
jgi:transposase